MSRLKHRLPRGFLFAIQFPSSNLSTDGPGAGLRHGSAVLVLTLPDLSRELGEDAVNWLAPQEKDRLKKFTSKRRRNFVLGRRAAKIAMHAVLGGGLYPQDLVVDNDIEGRPYLLNAPCQGLALSLSHTKGWAACLLYRVEESLGVDIEEVVDKPGRLSALRWMLEEEEASLLPAGGDALHRVWSLKEAAGKALGTGISAPPPQMRIGAYKDDGAGDPVVASFPNQDQRGWSWRLGSIVLAIVGRSYDYVEWEALPIRAINAFPHEDCHHLAYTASVFTLTWRNYHWTMCDP